MQDMEDEKLTINFFNLNNINSIFFNLGFAELGVVDIKIPANNEGA